MAEEVVVQPEEEVKPDEAEAEAALIAITDEKGNKMVPLSALIGVKREAKALGKKLKELEPIAARVTDVEGRLERASPIIEAVINNPKLRAAAMAKTRPSGEYTEQPDDDPDAREWAEVNELWTQDADGKSVLDVARAQRQLAIADRRAKRQSDETNRPLAAVVMNQRAEANMREALAMSDDDGVPMATAESIQETAKMLPAHLLANPDVVQLVINNAIGLDRRKGRTPKAPDEPLYLESSGGRGRRLDALTEEDHKFLKKSGMDEKHYRSTIDKMNNARPGKGIRLE